MGADKESRNEAKERRAQEMHELEKRLKETEIGLQEIELKERQSLAEEQAYDTAIKKIELADAIRKDEVFLAQDILNRTYWLTDPITPTSVSSTISTLRMWDRMDHGKPITIVVNSPGGSVIDGMALFDEIASLSQRGGGDTHVTIQVRGHAASMAAVLTQAADERVMGRESLLMIHEISTVAAGKTSTLKDEVEFLQRVEERVATIFAERSGGKTAKSTFKKLSARKDAWLDSAECLKHGFIDRIG